MVAAKDFITLHGHPSSDQKSQWLEICTLPGKGRGYVASQRIPAGTQVHKAKPLSAVVSQEWIPETCGWCFQFSYPKRMRHKIEIMDPNNSNKKMRAIVIKDVLFCSETCRQQFQAHGFSDESNLLLQSYYTLDQEYGRRILHKVDGLPTIRVPGGVDINDDTQLSDWIEQTWTAVQDRLQANWIPDGGERTMARLVACCLARRQSEYLFTDHALPKFNDLLDIQCNELAFVRHICNNLDNEIQLPEELIQVMQLYAFLSSATSTILDCPHDVFRSIYFREMANSFGLWEMPHKDAADGSVTDDLELLGWGIYPSAVYFNHACDANVTKVRKGRDMVFIAKRDIEPGEEACISYGCVEEPVQERRKRLLEHYHFLCACKRCESESLSEC
ncbi:hypothetical protein BJV82DRAFT_625349 [Fennellomyces sp. T-0311]|nr:hypothetical protein BJV82DRAFT_625349 [Fennellomyces sp. T-0311]